jgi:hypothetical protein
MAKKEVKNEPAVSKTPELTAAKKALETYLKENKLDPTKDWTKDKKHGAAVTKLVNKLNKERDKAAAKYPESDKKKMKKLVEKGERIAKGIEKKAKEAPGEAPVSHSKPLKYDYPLIDGREMTKDEKKNYRAEQRKKLKNSEKKEDSTKPSKKEKSRNEVKEKSGTINNKEKEAEKKKGVKKGKKKEED